MNCVRCNTPLIEHARFCSKCGYPAAMSQQGAEPQISSASQLPATPVPQAVQTPQPPIAPMASAQSSYAMPPTVPLVSEGVGGVFMGSERESVQPMMAHGSPLPHYQSGQMVGQGTKARPAVVSPSAQVKGRRRTAFLLGCVATVLLLLVLLVAGWIFALRPYLNNLAVSQLDQAMTGTVNQLPPFPFVPSGPVLVSESTLNTFITLNIPSSLPVQNTQAQISSAGIQISFQVYGLTGRISGVPKVVNGQLQLTNVTVNTLVSLILSPDDLATLVNTHIATALGRIHHSVRNVVLKDHEMDMLLV